ncbi:HAD family hydrolase [Simiduia curdlanivorans]|uniref:HAD family hydrolase n=1 Tax=Simiduia curdlanivorans TaxID=1492769 RepID=A0ABV8VAM3_9GAMM|nr:HAD family hydrolase [Simiduia curdlanivorans]MDN3639409.1 HAD family hydrolase [Simiduia curdlanivorans]
METLQLEQLAQSELPASPIRLAYFDIDGTLLDADGKLPAPVIQAIQRIQRQGVLTAFATGRPPFATEALQRQLSMNAPSVFYTGALCEAETICHADHTLALVELAPLLMQAQVYGFHAEVYYRDHYRVEAMSDIGHEHARHLGVAPVLDSMSRWPDLPIYKLLLGVDLTQCPQGLAALEKTWPQFQFAYAHLPSRPLWQFASVVSREVNKTTLFQQLLTYHGLAREQVIAFGDGGSDCEFLLSAGVGVAMDNASSAVKACANFVTRSSSKDGVAYALERLVPPL